MSGGLFAALAGLGASILITHTYTSARHTVAITLFALFVACLGFRSARIALRDKTSTAPPRSEIDTEIY
jgi:hypothetical protein